MIGTSEPGYQHSVSLLERKWFVWLIFAAIWTALACLGAWFNYHQRLFVGHPISWRHAILMNVIAYSVWAIVLTPLIMLICSHFPLEHGGFRRAIPFHVAASVVVGTLDALLRSVGWTALGMAESGFRRTFTSEFLFIFEMDLWNYWVVAAACHGFLYYTRYIDREQKALRLQNQLVNTELQLLKMQLQPHFLFNTLHAISAMVQVSPERAEQMITQLGDLLRITLEGVAVEEVTVKRELDFLQRYLDIQQTRFQGRLQVRMLVEPEVLDACIPYLLLQPLVENAVFHGVARTPGAGTIEVELRRADTTLCLAVRNDGPPVNSGNSKARSGIGLSNTRERLSRLYGQQQELRFVRHPGGGAEVKVNIPFKTEHPAEPVSHAFS